MGNASGIEDGFAATQPIKPHSSQQRLGLLEGSLAFLAVLSGGVIVGWVYVPPSMGTIGGAIVLLLLASFSGAFARSMAARGYQRRAAKEATRVRKAQKEQVEQDIIRAKVLGKFDRFGQ